MPKRIHRTTEWDEFMQHELACRLRYKHLMTVSHRGQDFVLKYRKGRWYWLADGFSTMKRRTLFCWITLGDAAVGALQMSEFDFENSLSVDFDYFLDSMDSVDGLTCELGVAISEGWPFLQDIADYGSFLHFERVWMEPAHSASGVWAQAARTLIAVEFQNYALMAMKAFPLEYEGSLNQINQLSFERRQRAMIRYYRKLFGVQPFPGNDGDRGWLWRLHPRLVGTVDEPSPQQASFE